MPEFMHGVWQLLPASLMPVAILGLAPLCGGATRRFFGVLLMLGGLGLAGFAATLTHQEAQLIVRNPFPMGGRMVFWVIETVTMPAWRWPVVAGTLLFIPGLVLWLRARRRPAPAHPIRLGVVIGLWCLLARLLLEKVAAPEALVSAVGLVPGLLVLLPILGLHARRRGMSLTSFVGSILFMALVQRAALIAWSYVATQQHLGTHLDVTAVKEANLWLFGAIGESDSAFQRWLTLVLLPQVVIWVPATGLAALALGWPAYLLTRPTAPGGRLLTKTH